MGRVAVIHEATLVPGKLELLDGWLARQPWVPADEGLRQLSLTRLGTYRFDDPDGEVGIEGFLLARGEALVHVVLTYRGAPLAGAEGSLVGTMEHSVLGTRWVYDGLGDPVAVEALERAVRGEQSQAVLELHAGGNVVGQREPDVRVRSAIVDAPMDAPTDGPTSGGSVAEVRGPRGVLRVARVLDPRGWSGRSLVAEWEGGEAVLASLA